MAKLKSDSTIARRIVTAFLDFLNSVELDNSSDAESVDVAKECLTEAFKIDPSVEDKTRISDLLVSVFTAIDANENQDSGLGQRSGVDSTVVEHSIDSSAEATQSKGGETLSDSSTPGLSKDDLFIQFIAALEKAQYFKEYIEDHCDSNHNDKATQYFHDAINDMEHGSKTFNLINLAESLKSQGNKAMQSKAYHEAIELYSCAIALIKPRTSRRRRMVRILCRRVRLLRRKSRLLRRKLSKTSIDTLPNDILLLIFTAVMDVETLIRCRSVCKRFHQIIPKVSSLVLRLDVLPNNDQYFTLTIYTPVVQRSQNKPVRILSCFETIKKLIIEPPAQNMNAAVRMDYNLNGWSAIVGSELVSWKAYFRKEMKGCVVVGMRSLIMTPVDDVEEDDKQRNLRMGYSWMCSALNAAIDCHAMASKVIVRKNIEMESMEVRDSEGKGCVLMDKGGLRDDVCDSILKFITWYEPRVVLDNGTTVEGALVMVVIRIESAQEERTLAADSFKGIYDELVAADSFPGIYGRLVERLVMGKDPYHVAGV